MDNSNQNPNDPLSQGLNPTPSTPTASDIPAEANPPQSSPSPTLPAVDPGMGQPSPLPDIAPATPPFEDPVAPTTAPAPQPLTPPPPPGGWSPNPADLGPVSSSIPTPGDIGVAPIPPPAPSPINPPTSDAAAPLTNDWSPFGTTPQAHPLMDTGGPPQATAAVPQPLEITPQPTFTPTATQPSSAPSIPPFDPSILGAPPNSPQSDAPTDLSQLAPTPAPSSPPVENYSPQTPENAVTPQQPTSPPQPPQPEEHPEEKGKFPIGLLLGGIITLAVVTAASIYFFFFAGKPPAPSSLPAEQETQLPLTTPPRQINPPGEATPSAGGFGTITPSPVGSTASPSASPKSAIERLRELNEQQSQ